MKHLLLSLALGLGFLASGQLTVTYPYNPDANADSAITSSDLLEFLPVFASEFAPQSIYVEGMSLEEFLTYLEASLLEAQTSTDSLQASCDLLQLNLDSLQSNFNSLQGILDSLLLENNTPSPCEDVDTDGVCDHVDACIGVSVTFEYSDPYDLFGGSLSQVTHCMEPNGEYGFFHLNDIYIQGGYLPDLLMQYTTMSNVTFSNCDLSGLQTWGNFYNVNFIHSDLSGGSFTMTFGSQTGGSFRGSNLSNTEWLYGGFRNVDFGYTDLTGASFSTLTVDSTTNFWGADFTDATFSCLSGESPILPDGYIWVPDTTCMYLSGNGPIPDMFTIVPE